MYELHALERRGRARLARFAVAVVGVVTGSLVVAAPAGAVPYQPCADYGVSNPVRNTTEANPRICEVAAGETIFFTVVSGAGGVGGIGGSYFDGGLGGLGGAGGANAGVKGSWTNTTGSTVTLAAAAGVHGTAGTNGSNGTSLSPSGTAGGVGGDGEPSSIRYWRTDVPDGFSPGWDTIVAVSGGAGGQGGLPGTASQAGAPGNNATRLGRVAWPTGTLPTGWSLFNDSVPRVEFGNPSPSVILPPPPPPSSTDASTTTEAPTTTAAPTTTVAEPVDQAATTAPPTTQAGPGGRLPNTGGEGAASMTALFLVSLGAAVVLIVRRRGAAI